MESSLIASFTDPRTKKAHAYVELPEIPPESDETIALEPTAEPPASNGLGCRFGGPALVPAGEPWPLAPDGRLLTLVCQVDFAEIAALGPSHFPDRGVLSFFYDVERQPSGHASGHERSWRAIYVEQTEMAIMRPSPHARPAQRIRPRRGPPGHRKPAHRLGGEGDWLHGDPRAGIALLADAGIESTVSAVRAAEARGVDVAAIAMRGADWRMLLQFSSDAFEWGDAGLLYVFIRESDLAARRFDRVWVDLQGS